MSVAPPPGVEDQVSHCRDYAEKQGWEVVDVFHDAERSGTTPVDQEGSFQPMVTAPYEFNAVLLEDIDRRSRDAGAVP